MHLLETQGLTKSYKGRTVANQVSIQISRGEIVGLLGPNGAGKTTTFYMVVGVIRADNGWILFRGEDVTHLPMYRRARMGMGYLSQEPSIFRKLTVEENIMAILETLNIPRTERRKRLEQLLEELDIAYLAKNKAYTLSGGERRRLEITRALVTNPSLILLDEPFSGLDVLVRDEFIRGILELSEQERWTVFVSSHDIDEVERLADWVGIIKDGELQLAETASSLQARFRKIEAVMPSEAQKPSPAPQTWLLVEQAGHRLSFVDSQYQEGVTERQLMDRVPGCGQIDSNPMSLRDIFLTLARTYRL